MTLSDALDTIRLFRSTLINDAMTQAINAILAHHDGLNADLAAAVDCHCGLRLPQCVPETCPIEALDRMGADAQRLGLDYEPIFNPLEHEQTK